MRYSLGDKLGDGGYASVHRCVDKHGNRYCAKVLPKAKNMRSNVQSEADIMRKLAFSLRVPKLVDVVEDNTNYYLIQEWCKGGTVTDYVNSRMRRFSDSVYAENTVASIIRGVVRSLLQVHSAGIIHRDVKHGNVLMADNDDDAIVKLCDYGLAMYCDFDRIEVKEMRGTPAFMAPENLSMRYSYKSDVWSMGVLTYQLLSGAMPFRDGEMSRLWHSILFKDPKFNSPAWNNVSSLGRDFAWACLLKSEAERISLEECLDHPWLKSTGCQDRFIGEPLLCVPFEFDMKAVTIAR